MAGKTFLAFPAHAQPAHVKGLHLPLHLVLRPEPGGCPRHADRKPYESCTSPTAPQAAMKSIMKSTISESWTDGCTYFLSNIVVGMRNMKNPFHISQGPMQYSKLRPVRLPEADNFGGGPETF